MKNAIFALLVACATLTSVHPAAAQASSASTQFDEARALIKEEKYSAAIPKLLDVLAHENSIGALFNLGVCYEKTGSVASAWKRFTAAEKLAHEKGDARESVAHEHAAALAPHLSKITITVPPAEDVAGFELKLDGVVLRRAEWQVPLPIDPGRHTIEAKAPGKQTWSTERSAGPSGGEWTSLAIGPLAAADQPEKPRAPLARIAPAPKEGGLGGQRIGALAAAGVGVVALGVGTVVAIGASSKNSDSKTHCLASDPNMCDPTGLSLRGDARSAGNLGTAMFVVGGVVLAAGAALWLTAPSRKSTTEVGVGPSGIAVRGTW